MDHTFYSFPCPPKGLIVLNQLLSNCITYLLKKFSGI